MDAERKLEKLNRSVWAALRMDFMDDALFSEALDDFELTAFPFVPSC